jgi:nicotinamidase-related amidase
MTISIPPNSTALLIIDMMNDHIHPQGVSARYGQGRSDGERETIVGNNQRILRAARAARLPVVHVRNEYRWDNLDCGTAAVRKEQHHGSYPPHEPYKIIGTWGAQIIDELAPDEDEPVIVKKNQSAFWFSALDQVLRHLGVETCLTTGGSVTGCLNDTVREGAGYGYDFIVVTDAVYKLNHPYLPSLKHCSSFSTTDDVLAALSTSSAGPGLPKLA